MFEASAIRKILLVRQGQELFALGTHCTHYVGPLVDGLIVGDTVRCPWHHACFSLHTGEALRAPALDSVPRWRVGKMGDMAFVREKIAEPGPKHAATTANLRSWPASVVIVGGGGAGLAAEEMLRREGYDGTLTMISGDDSPPCNRPNLSKDFLTGTAQEDWIPLRQPQFYTERRIELVLRFWVVALDLHKKQVQLENGTTYGFESLLIAIGAAPVRLEIPGAASSHIYYLRTFADSRGIVAKAASAKRVVVAGASFIGLKVSASLRIRGINVDVVARRWAWADAGNVSGKDADARTPRRHSESGSERDHATVGPGTVSPPHKHIGPVFAYILDGEIENQVEPNPPKTYKAGDYFYEPAKHVHKVLKNLSKAKPAELLIFQVGEQGKPFTISAK